MNIADKVRAYKAANPNANNKEVAKACNTSSAYVWQINKPEKVKQSKKQATDPANDPTNGQVVLRKEVSGLNKEIETLKDLNKTLASDLKVTKFTCSCLEEEVETLKTIVSYLEFKLGVENDGFAI